jgi:pseudouridine kinase
LNICRQYPIRESGFLQQTPLRIVVAGACHLDRKALAGSDYVLGASNPVSVATCPGGVAHNVAQNLRLLGCDVALVTRLGQDAEGDAIVAALLDLRLGRAGVSRSATAPTAFHLIVLQPDGEMLVAVADMRIYDEITPALLGDLPPKLWHADAIFADCNLSAETLGFLAGLRQKGGRLAVNGVSPAKVRRLTGLLSACDLLCVNRREAAALLEVEDERLRPEAAVAGLLAQGVAEVAMTLGAEGACFAAGDQVVSLPAPAARLVDVTGAGDALGAVFLEGRLRGLDLESAGRRALAAASLTIEAAESVSPQLSPEKLEELTA